MVCAVREVVLYLGRGVVFVQTCELVGTRLGFGVIASVKTNDQLSSY